MLLWMRCTRYGRNIGYQDDGDETSALLIEHCKRTPIQPRIRVNFATPLNPELHGSQSNPATDASIASTVPSGSKADPA